MLTNNFVKCDTYLLTTLTNNFVKCIYRIGVLYLKGRVNKVSLFLN